MILVLQKRAASYVAAHHSPGMKLLMENVLQFVEELHTRVRHVESLDSETGKEGDLEGDIMSHICLGKVEKTIPSSVIKQCIDV